MKKGMSAFVFHSIIVRWMMVIGCCVLKIVLVLSEELATNGARNRNRKGTRITCSIMKSWMFTE